MRLFITLALAIMILTACSSKQDSISEHMKKEHPNGITLMLSENWSADQTSNGFRVSTRESQFARIPEEVSVSLNSIDQKPEGEWLLTRNFNERLIHYRIDMKEGGSGGSIYILTAWEKIHNGYIRVEQYTQVEGHSSPDFSLAWKVFAGIELPGAAGHPNISPVKSKN